MTALVAGSGWLPAHVAGAAEGPSGDLRVVDQGDRLDFRDDVSPNGRYRILQPGAKAWRLDVKTGDRDLLPDHFWATDVTDDGRVLASRADDAGFRWFDVATGSTLDIGCGAFAGDCGSLVHVSGDGRYAAAISWAPGGEQTVYVLDTTTGMAKTVVGPEAGEAVSGHGMVGFTADDQYVIDSNPFIDVEYEGLDRPMIFDFSDGTFTPIVDDDGRQPAEISADGRYFTWLSYQSFVDADRDSERDVYQLDRTTGEITWISQPTRAGRATKARRRVSYDLAASPTGDYVLFGADPRSLLGKRSTVVQAILWDRRSGRFTIVSRDGRGRPGDDQSRPQTVSDKAHATFLSEGENLVPGGHDGKRATTRLYLWKP